MMMTTKEFKYLLATVGISALVSGACLATVSHAASSGGPANTNTPESQSTSQDRKKSESGKPGESCEKQPVATTCQKPDAGPGFGLIPGGGILPRK